ncbi:MAG: hypothetical protein JWO72_394 [Caulobacteraceae bacterium]|nr:hypothetical protein [Caulobacteraceae bacterium]
MKTLSAIACALTLALPMLAGAGAAHARPDLTGVWSIVGYSPSLKSVDGKPVPLKPEARAFYEKHLAATAKGDKAWDGAGACLPEGLPRLMVKNEPFEIIQRDKAVYFIHQNRLPHTAYLNEALPTDADPLYLGYSVGRWQGDTLVVESAGFRDVTALDDRGLPHSEALHLTERYTLGKDGKTLSVSTTIDDPNTFTRPWTAKATYSRKPASFEIPEEVCAERLYSTAPKR